MKVSAVRDFQVSDGYIDLITFVAAQPIVQTRVATKRP